MLQPIIQGNDKIIWGSDDVVREGTIVEDADIEPIVGEATIEGNKGFTQTHVMIPDGDERSYTMVCQTDIPLPRTGEIIKVWGRLCSCVKSTPKKARKKEMTAKVTAKRYAGIDYEALWDAQHPSSSNGAGSSFGGEDSVLASESAASSAIPMMAKRTAAKAKKPAASK